jgi:hypothetical protein
LWADPLYDKLIKWVEEDKNMEMVQYGHAMPSMGYTIAAWGVAQAGPRLFDKYVKKFFKTIIEHQNADGSFMQIPNKYEHSIAYAEKAYGKPFLTPLFLLALTADTGNLYFLSGYYAGYGPAAKEKLKGKKDGKGEKDNKDKNK